MQTRVCASVCLECVAPLLPPKNPIVLQPVLRVLGVGWAPPQSLSPLPQETMLPHPNPNPNPNPQETVLPGQAHNTGGCSRMAF